ncbi:DUF397 domain-containing protein [Amycolatopsis sp. NPDC051061]|uniref:DUF397 domain-containing protein n=1 Tax=Amycolatopsis sp. NPDC051061 TaxID=3155042 RepID=UPI0034454827
MTWRTSSYTGSQGNCVEVASGETVLVRDTKDRSGGTLAVEPRAWEAFLSAERCPGTPSEPRSR